jgi:Helix-turn-helix domain
MKSRKSPATDVERLVEELETLFVELRRLERDADAAESEEARAKLATFKRDAVGRLRDMIPAIWRLLDEAEFWRPGSLEEFHELCYSLPDARQSSVTWGPFLGKLRRLLLDSVAERTPASTGSAGKTNGYTGTPEVNGNGSIPRASVAALEPQVPAAPIAYRVQAPYMTVSAFAECTGQTAKAVYHQIYAHKIPVVRQGGKLYVNIKALDRWIESNTDLPR